MEADVRGQNEGELMKRRRGFTLIELLVVIAIIGLLLALVPVSLRQAKDQGKRVVCISNLRTYLLWRGPCMRMIMMDI